VVWGKKMKYDYDEIQRRYGNDALEELSKLVKNKS